MQHGPNRNEVCSWQGSSDNGSCAVGGIAVRSSSSSRANWRRPRSRRKPPWPKNSADLPPAPRISSSAGNSRNALSRPPELPSGRPAHQLSAPLGRGEPWPRRTFASRGEGDRAASGNDSVRRAFRDGAKRKRSPRIDNGFSTSRGWCLRWVFHSLHSAVRHLRNGLLLGGLAGLLIERGNPVCPGPPEQFQRPAQASLTDCGRMP